MSVIDPRVPANEHGVLRLYTLDLGTTAGRAFYDQLETGGPAADRAAAEALGADSADAHWLGLVAIKDLENVGLRAYLQQGYDIPEDQLDRAQSVLDHATGYVLAVPSRAFGGVAQLLSPAFEMKPLAQFTTDEAPDPALILDPADAADPGPSPHTQPPAPGPVPARQRGLGGRIILVILVVAALLIIGITQL
ncbi:MAG: hypothetical protein ACK5IB_10530 [Qingshengfaniella sp.]